ncbi:cardiolipin synthase [Paracoccus shanxieyensis]|uniref:Cardiolipin synthase n=1 Tax=Paracoccus shanxieyensis TaxID=2675752 RepID=A0A6L6J114_9RHOB|nr:cardiolipin synthase [Paracoccus shanxieyensis]MTH66263.1 cardiolipin synthase [Paracoccus shanxieyensis]MTH89525.1 cardiolipin synthase [Paracoccus shanxieyensis]
MWTQGLVFLHYAVALAVSVRVLLRPRLEPTVRLSWILVIELVPLVGILAYILFGEIRLRGADRETMTNVRSRLSGLWKPSPEALRNAPDFAAPIIAANRATTGFVAVAGNRATLLAEDDSAMADLVAALDDARDHVHLLFYIWLDDVSGRAVADAVIRAAGRGVKVRAVIDAFGSRAFARSESWQRMKDAGVECVEALPLGWPIIGSLVHRKDLRNHRKIVVIDHVTGFTGSRNCSDMAFAVKPRFAPWVDILLRIEGPVVRQMQAVFLQDWMSYTGEDLGDMLRMTGPVSAPGEIAQVVATGPDDRQGSLSDCMATMIHAARDKLVITTPYYVPDASLDSAIRTAARRGVDVTMVLPARNDSLTVQATSEGFYYGLVSAGVKLMLFQDGLLHAKIITVDGRMTMVGSANMDRRSFELNYEMNMLFLGGDLTEALDARQQTYIARAESITIGEIRAWSLWRRLRNNLLALAAPIL